MLGGFGVARERVAGAIAGKHQLHPESKLVARNRSIAQGDKREWRERSCYVPHPTR